MDEYVREFVEESDEAITELNTLLLELERSPSDSAVLGEIFRTAHTLKGNAGAIGLDRVSDLAHAFEDLLDAIRAGTVEVTPELMDTIFETVDALEAMIEEVARTGTVESDPELTIQRLREPLSPRGRPLEAPSDEEIDAILARFDPPTHPDYDAFLARMRIAESDDLNNGLVVVEALIDAFDLLGTDPSRTAIENNEHGDTVDAVFATAVGENAIRAALEPVDAVESFTITRVTDRFDAASPASIVDDELAAVTLSSDEANALSVDELLDEFSELDDIDALAETIDDASEFDDIDDAGSFDDLFAEAPADDDPETEPPASTADPSEPDDVEDANAVFSELKDEVEMVGFDELQAELDELEFDEFDEEEIGMDELLGDDVDVDDPAFLDIDADEGVAIGADDTGADVASTSWKTTDDVGDTSVDAEVSDETPASDLDDSVDEPTISDAPASESEIDWEPDPEADWEPDSEPETAPADAEPDSSEPGEPSLVDVSETVPPSDDPANGGQPDWIGEMGSDTAAGDDGRLTVDADDSVDVAETDSTADESPSPAGEADPAEFADALFGGGPANTEDSVEDAPPDEDEPELFGEPIDSADREPADAVDDVVAGDRQTEVEPSPTEQSIEASDETDATPDEATDSTNTPAVEPETGTLDSADDEGDDSGSVDDEDGGVGSAGDGPESAEPADAEPVELDSPTEFHADEDSIGDGPTDRSFSPDFDPDEAPTDVDAGDEFDDEDFFDPTGIPDPSEFTDETDSEVIDESGFDAGDEGAIDDAAEIDFGAGEKDAFEADEEDAFGADEEDVFGANEENAFEGSDAVDVGAAEEVDTVEGSADAFDPTADLADVSFDPDADASAATDLDAAVTDWDEDESTWVDDEGAEDAFPDVEPEPGVESDGFDEAFGMDGEATDAFVEFDEGDASFDDEGDESDEPDDPILSKLEAMEIPDISIPERTELDAESAVEEHAQSVRVDREAVDSLLQLVEGLVTSRVRLRSAVDDRVSYEELDHELDDLEEITTELQETVMDVRLVPIETVTNRLPRVVRDLAREQEKRIDFERENDGVELDRQLLDEIGDPLIHLVRNAVDHGIESPDEREDAGKPPAGTITISADRVRDRVTITVTDDGRGLDADRVREEAIDAGVVTADEADDLDASAVYDLVFHPGLSTASEVTDVSGRGVGMDVVRRTMETLNGSVSIESESGEGTSVTMTLPVSVAIDDVLFVESGGERFGLPVDVVKDVADGRHVTESDEGRVFDDGTESMPVIELGEALDAPTLSDERDGMVVRVRDDVRSVALHCETVHGRREVVINPFEGFMRHVPGVGGATVRGRGEVVTILDVATL